MKRFPFNFIFQSSLHVEIQEGSAQEVQGRKIIEDDGKYKIVVAIESEVIGEGVDAENDQVG
jgi:hypothetical protein